MPKLRIESNFVEKLKRFVKRKEIRNKGKKVLETSEKFLKTF